jgi:exopolysaccharide biosynthesis polyprenyl glycosylphosphotransferase
MVHHWRITRPWLLQVLSDILGLVAAYYATFWLRFNSDTGLRFFTWLNRWLDVRPTGMLGETFELHYLERAPFILGVLIAVVTILYAFLELYETRRFIRKRPVAWRVLLANCITLVLLFVWFYLHRNTFHPRSFFTTVIVMNIFCTVLFRSLLSRMVGWLRRRFHVDIWPVVLVGHNRHAEWITNLIHTVHPHGLALAEQMDFSPDAPFDRLLQQVRSAVQRHRAATLIVCDDRLTIAQIMAMLDLSDEMRLETKVLSEHFTVLLTRTWLSADMVHYLPLVHFTGSATSPWSSRAGLWFGRLTAAIAIAVLSPLMGIIALVIRLTSRGSAFFVQDRIGVNRIPFRMMKFRTMYHRADEAVAQLEEFNESGKGLFKIRNDPRITPAGRMLRRLSLDELPQLANVVRGEMALVGPRPLPRRDFERYYEDWHYGRHGGMPGLTCLWQVCGRSDLDFHNMCLLDIYYLKNQSIILDLQILLKTAWVVIFARGAY